MRNMTLNQMTLGAIIQYFTNKHDFSKRHDHDRFVLCQEHGDMLNDYSI